MNNPLLASALFLFMMLLLSPQFYRLGARIGAWLGQKIAARIWQTTVIRHYHNGEHIATTTVKTKYGHQATIQKPNGDKP